MHILVYVYYYEVKAGEQMRLSEIQQGEEIKLEVIINNTPYEFKSSVIGNADGGGIYTVPVRSKDKVVSFSSANVVVNLILTRQGRVPVVWKRVNVETVVYKKHTVYRITSLTLGMEENRRNAFRLTMGIAGVAQLGVNTKAVDVTIKDLSESGFSIISKENIEEPENIVVHLVFSDAGSSFSIFGLIVRKVEYGEDRFLYGCKMNQKVVALSRYINEKQRRLIVQQKGIELENGRTPKGFGDLRRQSSESEENDRRIRALAGDGNHKINNERYKNVNLESNNESKKKINYNRYGGLNLK
ncbi:MAG: PilZ domain-containing protein [Bacteroides sp.]